MGGTGDDDGPAANLDRISPDGSPRNTSFNIPVPTICRNLDKICIGLADNADKYKSGGTVYWRCL